MAAKVEIELRPHIGIDSGGNEVEHAQWLVLARITSETGNAIFYRQVGYQGHDRQGNATGGFTAIREFHQLPTAYKDLVVEALHNTLKKEVEVHTPPMLNQ